MIQIKNGISLKPFNTFGIESKTRYLAEATTTEQLSFTLNFASYYNVPVMVLGGGSNILFTKDFGGVIIRPKISGISIMEDTPDSLLVKVGAGVEWDDLVEWSINKNVYGLENLSYIPGNVGAAPIQNIGAYGAEVKDTVIRVEGIRIDNKKPFELLNSECRFGYRDSIFKNELKGNTIITYVWFKLNKNGTLITNYGNLEEELSKLGETSLESVRKTVINIRKKKLPDPELIGNAGSFFKNPIINMHDFTAIKSRFEKVPFYQISDEFVKIPAGWLIEQCGWKGKRIGSCGVHKEQALVLVNFGNATGNEILDLAKQIQKSIIDNFGIQLGFEVNII